MDTIDKYRQAIQAVLCEYATIPYRYADLNSFVVCDRENDHYLLLTMGWDGEKRVHGCDVHVNIIDGLVWIQEDHTEDGVADDLMAKGIPQERIVLGFHPADLRQYTDFAVA